MTREDYMAVREHRMPDEVAYGVFIKEPEKSS
jgi:hypothetical protein